MTQDTANTSLNERVIEAAIKAIAQLRASEDAVYIDRTIADAAIKAADQARAPEIIEAVERLMNAIADGNEAAENALSPVELIPYRDEVRASRRDLLAIFSIEAPT